MTRKTLGEVLRDLRTKKGMGVRELGRAADVSGVHISSLEKDKASPSGELIRKLADVLDGDVDKLLHLAKQVDPEVINVIQKNPYAVPSFLRSAKNLKKDQWEELMKQVQKMEGENK